MEIYVPYRCRIKLSYEELKALYIMLGRYRYEGGLQSRAWAEWVIKKRMEMMRRLVNRKKQYTLTLNAVDALLAYTLLANIPIYDPYEEALQYKINHHVFRLL